MRKQKGIKQIVIIMIFVIILAVIVSTGIVIVSLISSSKNPKPMSAAKNWDIVVDAQKPEYTGYVKLYYEQVTFVIDEQTHNDDGTGTAKVTVTTPDMQIILEDVLNNLNAGDSLSDERLAEQAQNHIEELLGQDCATITTTIQVPLEQVDNKWKIVANEEWNKAITSNMAEIYREYYDRILKEDAK